MFFQQAAGVRSEARSQRSEGRRQKAEGKRQKAGQKAKDQIFGSPERQVLEFLLIAQIVQNFNKVPLISDI
jgi:hypothetical protein